MNEENEHANDRDDVEVLVRLAGKRRAVPAERSARVRAAAEETWQGALRQRTRKRRVWTAAGLAAAAVLVLAFALRIVPFGTGEPVESGATILVESLKGSAWSRTASGQERRALSAGDAVATSAEIVTGEDGRLAIRLASGHSARLGGATAVRLLDPGSIALDRGVVYVDSGIDRTTAGSLRVHTPLGVVEEIGTQFEVRLEEAFIRLRLREGAVILRHDGATHEVNAGTELRMSRDGAVTRQSISTYGPDWSWVEAISPALDLRGRSARSFLDWVARERGWTLAFAEAGVAREADEIRLGGTVDRLTLDEALEAVLPTCRMTYRIEEDEGVLLISAAAE